MVKYCPCGSNIRYMDCCGAYIKNNKLPPTAEALMRSRYTAFVENNLDYIKKTMRPPASFEDSKKRNYNKHRQWTGLSILSAEAHPTNPAIGFVEFKASFREKNLDGTTHQKSEFHFLDGRWFYVDGYTPHK